MLHVFVTTWGSPLSGAATEDDNGMFARGDAPLSLGKMDNTATIWLAHAHLLCTFKLRHYPTGADFAFAAFWRKMEDCLVA